jgi:hypothetical protein
MCGLIQSKYNLPRVSIPFLFSLKEKPKSFGRRDTDLRALFLSYLARLYTWITGSPFIFFRMDITISEMVDLKGSVYVWRGPKPQLLDCYGLAFLLGQGFLLIGQFLFLEQYSIDGWFLIVIILRSKFPVIGFWTDCKGRHPVDVFHTVNVPRIFIWKIGTVLLFLLEGVMLICSVVIVCVVSETFDCNLFC